MDLEDWQSQEEEDAHRRERKRLSENYFNRAHALSAWLLATLIAVNGGAVLAITSRQPAAPYRTERPAAVFVLGLALALAAGLFAWWEAQDRSILYYLESLRPDRRTEKARGKLKRLQRRTSALRAAGRFANYASLVAFVGGCAWAAAASL